MIQRQASVSTALVSAAGFFSFSNPARWLARFAALGLPGHMNIPFAYLDPGIDAAVDFLRETEN